MYTVYGYDDMCLDFEYKFDSFVKAVKAYADLNRMCVAFINRECPGTCQNANSKAWMLMK